MAEQFDYCVWHFEKGADDTGYEQVQAIFDDDNTNTASQRASAAFIDAGVKIARGAQNHKACKKAFEKGAKKYTKAFDKTSKSLRKKDKFDIANDPGIAAIQARLSELWVEDQARRRTYATFRNGKDSGEQLWASALSRAHAILIDETSTAYMKKVLDEYDWVDIQRFGQKISNHAWLVVQHADRDPAFQALALKRMQPYLETNGVSKSNYAYLFDRVAVNHDRKQRYGTQPIWECTDTGLVLAPLENPASVNERRAEMGMGPVEESLAEMSRSVCGK